jgi:hypothetical protein
MATVKAASGKKERKNNSKMVGKGTATSLLKLRKRE